MEQFKFEKIVGYSLEGLYPKYGDGEFKVIMQDGDFYGELIVYHGGNILGCSLIRSVADSLEDVDMIIDMKRTENKKHAIVDEEGYLEGVRLFDSKGDDLVIEDTDFNSAIIGIVMTDYEFRKN